MNDPGSVAIRNHEGAADFRMVREMLARAQVPHSIDHDLKHWKETGGLGTEHVLAVENGPMILGMPGAESIWLFGSDGRLLGVVHYSPPPPSGPG